jgi:hypothetical protein
VAKAELTAALQRSPRLYGLARSRWWLAGVRQAIPWLRNYSLPGVLGVLRRFGLPYKRGRRYLHSPDLAYAEKLARVAAAWAQVQADPQRYVLVYEDELSDYRRPSVGYGYDQARGDHLRADQGLHGNRRMRIAGSLDVRTGGFFAWQRRGFDRITLLRYFQALAAAYPAAACIYVALDNWPVHFHPELVAALADCRIELLSLPTYAPWTNPTEKVWHLLYRQVLHLHDFVDRWPELQSEVGRFLDQYANPSPELLRYTGLLTD